MNNGIYRIHGNPSLTRRRNLHNNLYVELEGELIKLEDAIKNGDVIPN